MPARILIEEFHLTVSTTASSTDAAREAVRRLLRTRRFRGALRRAVGGVVRAFPALRRVHVALST
jgi:hypothetical protein